MVNSRPYLFVPKILSGLADITLICWASLISTTFFVSSFIELLSGDRSLITVYLLALIFLIIHFLIRQKLPERFAVKSKRRLTISEKMNNAFTDLLMRTFSALAASVAIFTIFWPKKIGFFINDWQVLAEKAAFSFFVYISLIVIFVIIIPAGIVFLATKFFPWLSYDGRRVKALSLILYLTFLLLLFIHIELLTERILEEEFITALIKYFLGIPLIFWLNYLFLGSNWLRQGQ